MQKRLKPLEIVAQIEAWGITLHSEYTHGRTKMKMTCPKGHDFEGSWDYLRNCKKEDRCTVCGRNAINQYHKDRGAKRFYQIMSDLKYQVIDEYQGNCVPVRFICDKGHEDKAPPNQIREGSICKYCSGALVYPDDVTKAFAARGWQLLESYIGNRRRMRFRCNKGHLWSMSWSDFQRGQNCAICIGRVVTHRYVKQCFADRGFILKSTYRRSDLPLKFVCPEGHHHQIRWNDFNLGQGCGLCNKPVVDPIEFDAKLKARGITPLALYVNYDTKIPCICPEGHQYNASYEILKRTEGSNRTGCPKCNGRHKTEEEKEILDVKLRIVFRVKDALKRYAKNGKISASCYAAEIVENVYRHLGPPPSKDYDLDHIVPLSFFNIVKKKEHDSAWQIDNLRWLPGNENSARGNRLSMEEVEQFTDAQLRILATASLRPSKFDGYLAERGIKFKPIKEKEDAVQLPLFGIGA